MMSPQESDARMINRWVLVHNQGRMLDVDKDRYGVDVNYFVGFAYVDLEAGLTIDVLSYAAVDGDRITLTKGPRDDNSSMKLRYTHAQPQGMSVQILMPEQQSALALPDEPEWLAGYKVDAQDTLDKLRAIEDLHPLRAPGFPDDIRFVLFPNKPPGTSPNQATRPEELWGKVVANPQETFYIVQLLNQPNQDFDGVKLGDFLVVQVRVEGDKISSVCVGKMNKP